MKVDIMQDVPRVWRNTIAKSIGYKMPPHVENQHFYVDDEVMVGTVGTAIIKEVAWCPFKYQTPMDEKGRINGKWVYKVMATKPIPFGEFPWDRAVYESDQLHLVKRGDVKYATCRDLCEAPFPFKLRPGMRVFIIDNAELLDIANIQEIEYKDGLQYRQLLEQGELFPTFADAAVFLTGLKQGWWQYPPRRLGKDNTDWHL